MKAGTTEQRAACSAKNNRKAACVGSLFFNIQPEVTHFFGNHPMFQKFYQFFVASYNCSLADFIAYIFDKVLTFEDTLFKQ